MAFSKLELHIIGQVAQSSEKLSAYDFLGEGRHYANIHRSCKKLIEVGVLEYDEVKNEKKATKKVLRLTLRGFCNFISTSDLCSTLFVYLGCNYSEDKLERFISLMEQWKHLHEGIASFYQLLMKYRDENEFPGVVSHILLAFHDGCNHTARLDDCPVYTVNDSTGDMEPVNFEGFFLMNIIRKMIDLPAETHFTISFDEITEIFKNTSCLDEFKNQMVKKVKDGEALYQWYIHYF